MWLFTFEFKFQRSKAQVIDYQNIVIDYNFFEINWNVVNSFENFFKFILLLVIDYNNLVIDY